MLKDIETIGLKIEEINPQINSIDIDIETDIKIKFNSHINVNTVLNNIILYEKATEERVSCNISCNENVVVLTPKGNLKNNTSYRVFIPKNRISDIIGRKTLLDFYSDFDTTTLIHSVKPEISSPVNNTIYSTNPTIKFISNTSANVIEISNTKAFTTLVYQKIVTGSEVETVINLDAPLQEGIHYLRIKTEDNVCSDLIQFYISLDNGNVSVSDYSQEVSYEDLFNEYKFLEFKPSNSVVSLNRRYIVYKFSGKVDKDKFAKCKHSILGESIDELSEVVTEHGYCDYNLIYMYDGFENITYIIFELYDLNDKVEIEEINNIEFDSLGETLEVTDGTLRVKDNSYADVDHSH